MFRLTNTTPMSLDSWRMRKWLQPIQMSGGAQQKRPFNLSWALLLLQRGLIRSLAPSESRRVGMLSYWAVPLAKHIRWSVARETGAVVGDRIFSDSLSDADGPASTYLAMMRHNLDAFTRALR